MFAPTILHFSWCISEEDIQGRIFSYIQRMKKVKSLKIRTGHTLYRVSDEEGKMTLEELEYLEFDIGQRRSRGYFDLFASLEMPSLRVVALVGRSSAIGSDEFFVKHGVRLTALEIYVPIPRVQSVMNNCPSLNDLIIDIDRCNPLVFSHPEV